MVRLISQPPSILLRTPMMLWWILHRSMMQPSDMFAWLDLRPVDLGGRQKARTGEDRGAHVEEIESGQIGCQV